MTDVISEVANELTQPTGQDRPTVELHFGTVTAVDAAGATLSAKIGEDTAVAGLPYLASYAPVVNDKVVLFRAGPGALVVIGSYRPLAGAALLYGVGTPEGTVTAPVGVIYRRTDGGVNTSLYVKQSGAGNTGWGPVPTTNGSPAFTGTMTVDGNFRAGAAATTPGAPVRLTGDTGPLGAPAIQFSPDSGVAQIWRGGPGSVSTNDLGCSNLSATAVAASGAITGQDTILARSGQSTQVRLGGYLLTSLASVTMGTAGDAGMKVGAFGDVTEILGRCQSNRFEHTGSLLGFYGNVGVSRPAAYNQPSIAGEVSADRNCPNWTPDAETSDYAFIDFTGAMAAMNQLRVAYENLRVHTINLTQLVNQLLDDLQAVGLVV